LRRNASQESGLMIRREDFDFRQTLWKLLLMQGKGLYSWLIAQSCI